MLIYKWTNKINNKIYVGKTEQSLKKRIKGYHRAVGSFRNGTSKSQYPIVFALSKYGFDQFIIEIIDVATTQMELNIKEQYWIKELNSNDPDVGYNILPGGGGGWSGGKHTEATKKKLSEQAKASGRFKGNNNPNAKIFDKHQEIILKFVTEQYTSNDLSKEYNVNLTTINRILKGIHRKPYHHSEETKNKIKGEKHGKSKLTENDVKNILQEYIDGTSTIGKLAEKYKVTYQSIYDIIIHKNWKHISI